MQADIRSKLEYCLSQRNLEEKDVIYIFVQIGKLIEITKTKDTYEALVFWRNICVHSEIYHQKAFILELKRRFKNIQNSGGNLAFGFVSMIELKNELIRFAHQQVSTELKIPKEFLESFKSALLKIVTDVPITLKFEEGEMVLSFTSTGEIIINGPGDFRGSMMILQE